MRRYTGGGLGFENRTDRHISIWKLSDSPRILQGFSKVHVGQLGSALTVICSELGIKFEKFQQSLQVFQTSRCNCDANTFLPDVLMLWC